MELCIVRHGIAEPRGDGPDEKRALTPKGRRRTQQAAEGLRALGCSPRRIATSPLRRAGETARILAEALCPDAPFMECDCLGPDGSVEDLVEWLGPLEEERVMIVGHMPGVAEFAAGLLCGAGDLEMTFKKAAACCISFEGRPAKGAGCLEWLLQPRQLRSLGHSQGE